jgi:hypothetical protein
MISTLIKDIQELVTRKDGWFDEELSQTFANETASRVRGQFQNKEKPTLRLSQMGPRCPRALWYSIHAPDEAEPLPPWAEVKYTYGHVIEALAITLAKASGHSVVGEQDAVYVDGITGHRDCVIDGCVVDVKSTSSFGFSKFKDGSLKENDSFGYLDQLDGYIVGSLEDPLVSVKDRGYLLAVDKTLGHMVLYEHHLREQSIHDRISTAKRIVELTTPPQCMCGTKPIGKSGNIGLDVRASYNNFKHSCFPGLRTFLYADGPQYLVHVERKPEVIEVDRHGKIVYH